MRKHDNINGNGSQGGASTAVAPLRAGDTLTRAEFLRRWKQHPEIKYAELIGGIVYMPSPLTRQHGVTDKASGGWLWVYHVHTPGTETGTNATTLMEGEAAPQPDEYLRILPEYGGQSTNAGKYVGGSPELICETCVSSASYDLHQKLDLYEKMRVLEVVAFLLHEQEVRWHCLGAKGYERMIPVKGIWKSKVFPGLWLNGEALLANDGAKILATLNKGLRSPQHAAFVRNLARKAKK
jgi:Uma2 family endonuclease